MTARACAVSKLNTFPVPLFMARILVSGAEINNVRIEAP
ncbi:hypothetical protein ACVWZN_001904 [Lysobacter sp. HA35]